MSDPRMTDFDFSQAEALAEMLRIQEAVGRELGVPVAVPRPVPAMDLPAAIDAFVASATTGAVTERDFGMAEALLSRLPESERAEAKAEINRRIADDRRRTETQNIQPLTGPTTTGELASGPPFCSV